MEVCSGVELLEFRLYQERSEVVPHLIDKQSPACTRLAMLGFGFTPAHKDDVVPLTNTYP